jgi:hypothetical protein
MEPVAIHFTGAALSLGDMQTSLSFQLPEGDRPSDVHLARVRHTATLVINDVTVPPLSTDGERKAVSFAARTLFSEDVTRMLKQHWGTGAVASMELPLDVTVLVEVTPDGLRIIKK